MDSKTLIEKQKPQIQLTVKTVFRTFLEGIGYFAEIEFAVRGNDLDIEMLGFDPYETCQGDIDEFISNAGNLRYDEEGGVFILDFKGSDGSEATEEYFPNELVDLILGNYIVDCRLIPETIPRTIESVKDLYRLNDMEKPCEIFVRKNEETFILSDYYIEGEAWLQSVIPVGTDNRFRCHTTSDLASRIGMESCGDEWDCAEDPLKAVCDLKVRFVEGRICDADLKAIEQENHYVTIKDDSIWISIESAN